MFKRKEIKLEIADQNSVLVDIPFGKITLSKPDISHLQIVDQKRQNGPFCWFFALNLDPSMKPRFGKAYANHPYRKIEQAISLHVKERRTAIRNQFAFQNKYQELIEDLDADFPDTKFNKEFINAILNEEAYLDEKELFNEFLKSNENDFNDFVDGKLADPDINICKKLLTTLGYNPENVFCEFYLKYKNEFGDPDYENLKNLSPATLYPIAIKEVPPAQRKTIYLRASQCKIHEQLNLKQSAWKPTDNIHKLISALKEEGALIVGGQLGLTSYTSDPFRTHENFGKRAVYGWKAGQYQAGEQHKILVVGAKKENGQDYVYFMDPNDGNPKNSGIIYKISYTRFLDGIRNILGYPYSKNKGNELPVDAFHGVYDFDRMKEFYPLYQNFLSTDSIEELSITQQSDSIKSIGSV